MTAAPPWLAGALCPEIAISDHAGTVRYRWEHPLTHPNPRQDVALTSWDIRAGINSDAGSASIVLRDDGNALTDKDSPSRRLLVRPGWQLEIWLQKPGRARYKWFHGVIEQPVALRPGNARQDVIITAIGWGVRLAHRFGSVAYYQRRLADGITHDPADGTARASEIVKRVVTDTDILVSPSTGSPLGITANGVDDIDIKMPDFVRHFQSLGLMVSELAQAVGCVYHVSPDRDLSFHLRAAHSSGFLISNDHGHGNGGDSGLLHEWADADRAAIASDEPYGIRESSIAAGYSTLIGLGAIHEEIAASREAQPAPGAAGTPLALPENTDTAFTFRLGRHSLAKIALRLSRTGDAAAALRVSLVGSDTGSAIDPSDVRAVDVITPERLNRELAADGAPQYVEVGFEREPIRLYPQADMHVIIRGTADPVRLHVSGTGTVQRRAGAPAASPWSAISGGAPNYRAYAAETVHIVAQDTTRREYQGHKETTYPLHDYPTEEAALIALRGQLELVGSTRRSYDSIIISAPAARPQPGHTVRLVDVLAGSDTEPELIGYRVGAADGAQQLAAERMSIDVEEWITA